MNEARLPALLDTQAVGWPAPRAQAAPAGPDEYRDLSDYAGVLFQHKRLLALVTIAGALAGGAITGRLPKTYRSEAFLEIQTPNENFLNLRDVTANGSPVYSEESYVQTQTALLRQNSLVEQTLIRLKLERHPEFNPGPGMFGREVGLQSPEVRLQRAVEMARQKLTIEPYKKSRIVRIVYESGDPQIAADVPNTLGQLFIESSSEGRWEQAKQTNTWLQPEMREAKTKLDQAEYQLQEFLRSAGLGANPGGETLVEERLRQLQIELSKAESERISLQSQQDAGSEPKPVAADNEGIRQLQMRLTELKREYADLNTVLRPESYKVARVKAQITELETAVQEELTQIRQRAKTAFTAAQKRESLLAEGFARQAEVTSEVASRVVQYQRLKSEAEGARTFYDSMRKKTNDARVASAVRPSNVRMVGPALPPLGPVKPSLPLNVALGGGLGLIAGIVLAASRIPRQRLTVPGQSERYLRLPELGAIPDAAPLTTGMRRLLETSQTQPPAGIERVALEQRSSPLSESFRWALVSLLSAKVGGRSPKVMAVTSPLSGDGKTTIVANLGITLAQTGKRVLLIDGDMRGARLHEIFHLRNQFGLSDLLLDETAAAKFSVGGLALAAVPGLWVLPSGSLAAEVDSLMYSQERMAQILGRLREEFDYVLIDAPSVSASTDSRVLSDNADGVVLVVRANTDDQTVLATAQRLTVDGAKLLGTILNSWNGRSGLFALRGGNGSNDSDSRTE